MDYGVLIFGSPIHSVFLERSLECFSKLECPVVMGWDDCEFHNYPVPKNIELFTTGTILGKIPGSTKQLREAIPRLRSKGCKYLVITYADTLMNNLAGLEVLQKEIEGYDFMSRPFPSGNYDYCCMICELDAVEKVMDRCNSVEESLMTNAVRELGYTHKVFDCREAVGYVHLQKDWFDKVRSDKQLLDILGETVKMEGKFMHLKKSNISALANKVKDRVEKLTDFDMNLIGFVVQDDCISITPIAEPLWMKEAGGRSVRDWFIDCVNLKLDFLSSCPIKFIFLEEGFSGNVGIEKWEH